MTLLQHFTSFSEHIARLTEPLVPDTLHGILLILFNLAEPTIHLSGFLALIDVIAFFKPKTKNLYPTV